MDDVRIIEIARAALRQPPEDRADFLDATCDSEAIRREVEALLAADAAAEAEQFLEDPLLDLPGWETVAERRAGSRIGPYVIEEVIGTGGMGVVYGARDPRLERRVALKVLPDVGQEDDEARARFLREARAASALDHPNICTIYEIDRTEVGELYIAMACYEGRTLADRLRAGPLPVGDAVDILEQAARGLTAAHAAGITHRDIKPSNLFLTETGVVKVLDFGIAKLEGHPDLTRTERIVGTVAYMAPEQARGERVDHRADIWSLGVVAYEMFTGSHPFRRSVPAATLYALQHDASPSLRRECPDASPSLERLVHRMLAKDPDERVASMADVLAALDTPASFESGSVRTNRHAARWGMGGIGLMVAVLWVTLTFIDAEPRGEFHTIAVLPLANHAVDTALAPLAEGMTDALITDLAQIDGLRVISRTSVQAYRDSGKPLPVVAEELGVTAIVEGAVQADDEQVGITVQLVDAEADRILWSEHYARPLRNVITLQHEVALAIAQEIEASLSPEVQEHLAMTPEIDPDAYKAYLWGLYYRNRETAASWQEAALWLERSIAIDATYAPAHALLASVLIQSPDSAQVEAGRRAAERALRLDATLPVAHVALGLYQELVAWDWVAAERAFRRAIELAPGNAEAHHELGLLLMRQRRFEEALPHVQQAVYLDPLSARMLNGVAAVHLFARRYAEAIDVLQQSLALDDENAPTYWRLGIAYQGLGRHDEAISAFERLIALGGTQAVGHLGHALAVAGRRAEAMAQRDTLVAEIEAAAPDSWRAYNLALIHAGLDDGATALTWLERAYQTRSLLLVYLDVVPAFDPLRDHSRFQALRRAIGLASPAAVAAPLARIG